MRNTLIVVSRNADKTLKSNLTKYGVIFEISENHTVAEYESCHPDMQICKTTDSSCIISPYIDKNILKVFDDNNISFEFGNTTLSPIYPNNVAYNVLVGDKIFIHNTNYTDKLLYDRLVELGKRSVYVKQGYSGCSSVFVNDVIITSDYGVYKKTVKENIKTILFREPSKIKLEGFNNGFIGGCCGYSKNTGLLINCDYTYLPEDFEADLKRFNINFTCVGIDELTDIGGIMIFTK